MHDDETSGRLETARERAAEKAALEARLATLKGQISVRVFEVADLDARLRSEEADVRRLEGMSLSAMFAAMLGTKEERLAKERAEALRAQLARDAGREALHTLQVDDARIRERIAALGDVEGALAAALRAKEADLAARGDPVAHRLAEIDALVADARAVAKEVSEAEDAASDALRALDRVDAPLQSARNWGTWDMLGGGTFATWAKHSRIDDARAAAHDAQRALDRFAREMADVRGLASRGSLVVEIGGFSKFADYFFDGLVADWVVQSRITQSQANVTATRSRVSDARRRLAERRQEIGRELKRLAAEREALVAGA